MGDALVLLVVIVVPAAVLLGPLALLTLGVAAVADLDGNGLVRSTQPAPGSSSDAKAADGSVTTGPASRMSSVTPSA
jgi:hypothetical protein